MKRHHLNILYAGGLIGVGIFTIYTIRNVKKIGRLIDLGAAFFPRLLAGILIAMCLALIIISLRNAKRNVDEDEDEADAEFDPRSENATDARDFITRHTQLLSIALIFIYVFLFQRLGFIVSSAIYLFAQMNILTKASRIEALLLFVIACVAPLATYFIFTRGFNLMLPSGVLNMF